MYCEAVEVQQNERQLTLWISALSSFVGSSLSSKETAVVSAIRLKSSSRLECICTLRQHSRNIMPRWTLGVPSPPIGLSQRNLPPHVIELCESIVNLTVCPCLKKTEVRKPVDCWYDVLS